MSRKPVDRWLTATYCFIQQQERHSQNEPSVLCTTVYWFPSLNNSIVAVLAPSGVTPFNHQNLPFGRAAIRSQLPMSRGSATPNKTNPPPLFSCLATREFGIHLHNRVAGSDLDHSKQLVQECKAQLMQDSSPNTAYKNVGDWFLGPVNHSGAPALRGRSAEEKSSCPKLPRSFGTAPSMYLPVIFTCADSMGCISVEPHAGINAPSYD